MTNVIPLAIVYNEDKKRMHVKQSCMLPTASYICRASASDNYMMQNLENSAD
jgi:hypothetical protein